MSKKLCFWFAVLAIVHAGLYAQDKPQEPAAPPANPITQSEKGLYLFMSDAVVSAAEKMPEENYSFKPTPDVRSFGQLVGHVADANYMFCSQATAKRIRIRTSRKRRLQRPILSPADQRCGCILQQDLSTV